MARTATRLTYDDLESIPQEREGDRHEIIHGELIVTPSPVPRHQIISINIEYALVHHVRQHGLGVVLDAPIDLRFTPDNVLVPDIIFVAQDRRNVIGSKAVEAAPELVVEVLSLSTRRRDLTTKRELYARFGVQEYWIVDPDERSVTVLGLVGSRFEQIPLNEDRTIQSRILPALTLTLDEVFAGTD